MASRGKKKTTMAKLTRESRLRERRIEKKARKEARKLAPVDEPNEPLEGEAGVEGEARVEGEAEVTVEH
jgi:hypothetical protein